MKLKALRCKVNKHDLLPLETLVVEIKKFECRNCKQVFTTNGYGNIVKMDATWEKNHQLFLAYYSKRAAIL